MMRPASLKSKALADAGLYIMRSERIYLLAVCNPIGVKGTGPHKHNDWLSFELVVDDQPVIIDPGTYCYTGNIELRRLFRSTAYHNTVVIDGEEQLKIDRSDFSLIKPHGEVSVLRWESDSSHDLLEAQHTGYTRLDLPVIHRRSFFLDKSNHSVAISDVFVAEGEHTIEWFLHLDVGLICQVGQTEISICSGKNPIANLVCQGWDSLWEINNGWVSRAYNKRDRAQMLYARFHRGAPYKGSFVQRFCPIINKAAS